LGFAERRFQLRAAQLSLSHTERYVTPGSGAQPASSARKYVPDDHHGQQDQKDARKGSAT
jgi:hypothetical protein